MHKLLLLVIFSLVLTLQSSVRAQICGSGYDRPDRPLVKQQYFEIEPVFHRMMQLATMSANGTLSNTQRSALESEFIALRDEISRFGDEYRTRASSQTNQFLSEVMDAGYLGLTSLTIQGRTTEEAQVNARNALDKVFNSVATLQLCLWGSWDRHIINESVFDGRLCAGGYDSSDARLVRRQSFGVKAVLTQMANVARAGVEQVLSATQRKANQFDFEFLKEQLDIYGSAYYPRASRRTNEFLKTIVDPGYLGLMQLTVDGVTIAEAQANARVALDNVNNALSTVLTCFAYFGSSTVKR